MKIKLERTIQDEKERFFFKLSGNDSLQVQLYGQIRFSIKDSNSRWLTNDPAKPWSNVQDGTTVLAPLAFAHREDGVNLFISPELARNLAALETYQFHVFPGDGVGSELQAALHPEILPEEQQEPQAEPAAPVSALPEEPAGEAGASAAASIEQTVETSAGQVEEPPDKGPDISEGAPVIRAEEQKPAEVSSEPTKSPETELLEPASPKAEPEAAPGTKVPPYVLDTPRRKSSSRPSREFGSSLAEERDRRAKSGRGPIIAVLIILVAAIILGVLYWNLKKFDSPGTGPTSGQASKQTASATPAPGGDLAPLPEAKQLLATDPSAEAAIQLATSLHRKPDSADAIFLLMEYAARKGHPQAMLETGQYYDPLFPPLGTIEKDPGEAYSWYVKAGTGGENKAADNLKALKEWAEKEAQAGSDTARYLLNNWK